MEKQNDWKFFVIKNFIGRFMNIGKICATFQAHIFMKIAC